MGMLDSIHLARWLKQFIASEVELVVFPSGRFRRFHPDIELMLRNGEIALYRKISLSGLQIAGYLDFFSFEIPYVTLKLARRAQSLRNYLRRFKPDIVHLIELQHAGYLFLDTKIVDKDFNLIVTNYGSDLFYFQNYPEHRDKIKNILKLADYYSAECRRDYELASSLGFSGTQLALIPNAGGFALNIMEGPLIDFDRRNLIYVKGYGGRFGLGNLALEATSQVLDEFLTIEVVVVSLTNDLETQANDLEKKFGKRITIHRLSEKLSQFEILALLKKSIVCIGASRSDGISTTFLEALITGTIPVQTNTSCANEWLEKGFTAKIIGPSSEEIYNSVSEIIKRKAEFAIHSRTNVALSRKHLNSEDIASVARTFYQIED